MKPEERQIIAAAVRYVMGEHLVTTDLETVRRARQSYDAMVEAVCAADPTVAKLVKSWQRRSNALRRAHNAAIDAAWQEAHS